MHARELRANPTVERRTLYTDTRRQLQNNIRANKRECEQNVCANIVDMKSYSKIVKSIVGTKAPPIGMLIDPDTGIETNSIEEVARVLLDKHLPGSKNPNHNHNPKKMQDQTTKDDRSGCQGPQIYHSYKTYGSV
jgi:hypothetical protein